eukprot:8886546-Pyramimonas_sp.AAC.1
MSCARAHPRASRTPNNCAHGRGDGSMPQGAGRRKNARTKSGGVRNVVVMMPRRRPERRSQRHRRSPPDG